MQVTRFNLYIVRFFNSFELIVSQKNYKIVIVGPPLSKLKVKNFVQFLFFVQVKIHFSGTEWANLKF